MCGIAGIVGEGVGGAADRAVVERMLATMVHRGPDDEGVVASEGRVLGARRLSIVDVEHGRQPLVTEDGALALALNGEVYGHDALRRDLEARGATFRTRSDTEVLLRLLAADGDAALDRIEGMYAFAAHDARTRRLWLVRDRLGEKPLLWFVARGRIVFASEWRALREHPDAPRDLDDDAIALLLLHRYVPAPRTAIRGVSALPPAHVLRFEAGRAVVTPYWTLPVPAPDAARARGGFAAAAAEVRARLEAAVASRVTAEVPVGVFLSGGLDSAAIAALASRTARVETFTLRPDDPDFDEGDGARATAHAIGSVHHEVALDGAAVLTGFEEVFAGIDAPIGDASLVPTLALARAARRRVKVVLGGEGADEAFGGYPTYLGARHARRARFVPGPARRLLARLLRGGPSRNVGTRFLLRRLLDGAGQPLLERHLEWFGAFGAAEQASMWRAEARPAIVGEGLLGPIREATAPALSTGDDVDALLRADLLLHLPGALLAKVDLTTMLASLEARAPFLERSLVETAARLPAAWKVRGLRTKRVLRAALADVVPANALRARKRGFAVPVARALVGPLGDRLAERLRGARLVRDRFDPAYPTTLLAEHRAGRADHSRRLYTLLALLEWSERWA